MLFPPDKQIRYWLSPLFHIAWFNLVYKVPVCSTLLLVNSVR